MASGPRKAPGERAGPFEFVRFLAEGGMGAVYLARDTRTGAEVALKVMSDDASGSGLERFEREARLSSLLRHPHIVEGRGHGRTATGEPWIAMELLEGEDLERTLRKRGVSPAVAVEVVLQLCEALAFAHDRRVIHRDLKPQNVFLRAGDALDVKVLDFGVARFSDDQKLTGTGHIVGSWPYMSPEQARAEPDLDARSDLWSLGVLLYECLAGTLPFDAPTGPGTLYKILFEPPTPLERLRPGLPPALVALVHRCLHKVREERYSSAEALRAALALVDTSSLPAEPRPLRRVLPAGDGTLDEPAFEPTQLPDTGVAAAQGHDETAEVRLSTVVFLREVREPALVERVALELRGRVQTLVRQDMVVVFGAERWSGEEPEHAVRLASAVAGVVRGVGVCTGRALRSLARITGAAVDAAVGLASREGVWLDPATVSVLRGPFVLSVMPDGSARLEVRPRRRPALSVAQTMGPLLGRELELGALLQCAETAASEQQPGAVVVLGSPGLGKSRLRLAALGEFAGAHAEAVLLFARCEPLRRDAPFATVREALVEHVDPSLLSVFAPSGEANAPAVGLDRARSTFELLLRELHARGPLVLALDDTQWLDPSSQDLLRWAQETLTDLSLALWLFARPEARGAMATIAPGATVFELKPLTRAHALELTRAIAGEAPDELLERAGGNPLFLEELARLYRAQGGSAGGAHLPASIEGALLAQLDPLEPPAREFLKRGAVFGRTAWVEAVTQLGGEAAGFERLRTAGLVLPRPRSRFEGAREFGLRSGSLHEVAYSLWPEPQRARLHERAAEWLGARAGVTPEELAYHWEQAQQNERAAECFAAAAEASAQVSDAATTRAQAERSLGLTQTPALRWRALVARDHALQATGNYDVQREGLAELARLAPALGPEAEAECAWRQCFLARMTRAWDEARAFGAHGAALSERASLARWGALAHNELALLCADRAEFTAAREHAQTARKLANASALEWLKAQVTGTQAYVMGMSGDHRAALDLFELAAARSARAGDRRREGLYLLNAGSALHALGRLGEAAARLETAMESSRKVGNQRSYASAMHNLGLVLRLRGQLSQARELQQRAEVEALKLDYRPLLLNIALERTWLALRESGAGSQATAEALSPARLLAEQLGAPRWLLRVRALALRSDLARGVPVDDEVRSLTEALATQTAEPDLRAEVLGALLLARPNDEALAQSLEAAMGELLEGVDSEGERQSVLDVLRARFLAA